MIPCWRGNNRTCIWRMSFSELKMVCEAEEGSTVILSLDEAALPVGQEWQLRRMQCATKGTAANRQENWPVTKVTRSRTRAGSSQRWKRREAGFFQVEVNNIQCYISLRSPSSIPKCHVASSLPFGLLLLTNPISSPSISTAGFTTDISHPNFSLYHVS